MSQMEAQLLEALIALDRAVKSMAASNQPVNLMPLLTRIDALGAGLPPETDPQLVHFIQRKSFEKALLWLQGRKAAITRGICGH